MVEKYASDNRIFLGGDCCHTHSVSLVPHLGAKLKRLLTHCQPKAGQGMNTAFHDALNLAWKIHHVEGGFANRSIRSTYESERKLIAENLLSFDAKYAALFSQKTPSADQVDAASQNLHNDSTTEENEFIKTFKANQEFTSGYGILYPANEFNWSPAHPAKSSLFKHEDSKLRPGYVMPNANVTRVVDANLVHLEQAVPLNGSFRIFVFAGKPSTTRPALADLATNLQKPSSFYKAYERADQATVSYHERDNPHSHFFTICTIFRASKADIEIVRTVPALMARYSDHVYADNGSAHAKMGLDARVGGLVIVRPDGHVRCAVRLVEGNGTADALNEYFGAFVSKKIGRHDIQARM